MASHLHDCVWSISGIPVQKCYLPSKQLRLPEMLHFDLLDTSSDLVCSFIFHFILLFKCQNSNLSQKPSNAHHSQFILTFSFSQGNAQRWSRANDLQQISVVHFAKSISYKKSLNKFNLKGKWGVKEDFTSGIAVLLLRLHIDDQNTLGTLSTISSDTRMARKSKSGKKLLYCTSCTPGYIGI